VKCVGERLDVPGTVLIDDRNIEQRTGRTYLLCDPVSTITAHSYADVQGALESLDRCLDAGLFVAGYISYEAGAALDKPIRPKCHTYLPLIWLGVYEECAELDSEQLSFETGACDDVQDARLSVDEQHYLECIERIKQYIADGDVYQVNFTSKLKFTHVKPARYLFSRLRSEHPVGHSAFINIGSAQIMSLSPELFLRRTGDRVLTRPMKGTIRRGRWPQEDSEVARQLASDPKNRAENVMIVDLMRNDLGRVCKFGEVSVPRLFHVERYSSLHQMTSDVSGILRDDVSASRLLEATFPAGSITGAPKIRAMEIINELESDARGVYCGSIGMFRPGGDCLLNVAIRTIVQQGMECEMGVGGGIVSDSDPRMEMQEMLLKGRFLQRGVPCFRLLETLRYDIGSGYSCLEDHIMRMGESAGYFGWPFTEDAVREVLAEASSLISADAVQSCASYRVRLLLDRYGGCKTEWLPLRSVDGPVRLILAPRRTDPADVFLYHKTTNRSAYDSDLAEATAAGYFDLVYLNSRGEITEGAITNIVLEIGGKCYTPPLDSGILPGIWRMGELSSGRAVERCLYLDDLRHATRVVVGNSVRGGIEVDAVVDPSECADQQIVFQRSSS